MCTKWKALAFTIALALMSLTGHSDPISSDKPRAPTGLKADVESSGAILLSWEPAISPPALPVVGYAIRYAPTQSGQEAKEIVVNTTSHLFDSLKPNTNYTFRVRAYNSKGASKLSKRIVQVTGENGDQPEAPTGLQAVTKSALGLSLGFSALSPPLVFARGNHPALLNCTGHSEEGPLRVSWRIEDMDLMILWNGSLRIDRLAPQHEKRERGSDGKYTCVLRNDVGVLLSTPIQVVLARMSENFTREPQPQNAIGGGQALFSCEIDAVPPATTTWYLNGVQIPRNHSRYTILPSGSLLITGITLNEFGRYKCQCSNIAGVKNSSEAWLLPRARLFSPPVFLHPRHQVSAVAGTPAVLECFADGFPKVEYSWKREDGKEITGHHLLKDSNLFFPEVQPAHAGTYICSAKVSMEGGGQIQEESHSIQVFLIVYAPPIFTKVPTSQTIPASGTVRFYCEVESHPASTVYWVKDGERLIMNGRIKLTPRDTLVVSDTVTSDSGIYQCVASNPDGVNTSAARLLVRVSSDQPQAPTLLKAVAVSSSAISLSWEPAHSPPSLPIHAYSIRYAPTQGGPEEKVIAVNTSHLIDRLKPHTGYTFYVRAYNSKGASEPSESVVQMTGEDDNSGSVDEKKTEHLPGLPWGPSAPAENFGGRPTPGSEPQKSALEPDLANSSANSL